MKHKTSSFDYRLLLHKPWAMFRIKRGRTPATEVWAVRDHARVNTPSHREIKTGRRRGRNKFSFKRRCSDVRPTSGRKAAAEVSGVDLILGSQCQHWLRGDEEGRPTIISAGTFPQGGLWGGPGEGQRRIELHRWRSWYCHTYHQLCTLISSCVEKGLTHNFSLFAFLM